MAKTKTLKQYLLDALKDLPGTRQFHVHALVSAPRKHTNLFQFAIPRPKVFLQDVLVLLSEQSTADSARVFVSAVEASLFSVPSTSSGILYVSKVDSTGQASSPAPTAAIVRSLLAFYGDPATRPLDVNYFWIQIFARAQGQYLFPNSSECSAKRPLSDVKLCSWWKRVLTNVADELENRNGSGICVKRYYVLPGFGELEAIQTLKRTSLDVPDRSKNHSWNYGHPYAQKDIPLPCPNNHNVLNTNLGHYIPWFDDDPKSRFLDEIAYAGEGGTRSPERKRPRMECHTESPDPKASVDAKEGCGVKDRRPTGELGRVSADEFWERMSFRQECVAGAVTGFFTLIVSTVNSLEDASRTSTQPLSAQPGQVPSQVVKRILSSLMTGVEFSTLERAFRATETIEGAIRGLCEGVAKNPATTMYTPPGSKDTIEGAASGAVDQTPPTREKSISEITVDNPLPPTPTKEVDIAGEGGVREKINILQAKKKRK